MSIWDKLDKREDPEYIGDPRKQKGTDSLASNIISNMNAPDYHKKVGIGNTTMIEATPIFNKAECEKEIRHDNINAGIVFGRDRPGDHLSGYGGSGVKRSSTIDIVVGRMGPEAASTNGMNELIYVENNFFMDAARIYISQRTNIDHNFRVKSTFHPPAKDCSAIGIKADSVRLLARKDIKLVTGLDYYDSRGSVPGADYLVPCKISLIGDNRDDLLQPMVKGENLVNYILELAECMQNTLSTIESFMMHQNKINFATINHTHRDKINVNTFGFPSERLIFEGYQPALKLVTEVKASLIELAAKIDTTNLEYVGIPSDGGLTNDKNILSNYNFCN